MVKPRSQGLPLYIPLYLFHTTSRRRFMTSSTRSIQASASRSLKHWAAISALFVGILLPTAFALGKAAKASLSDVGIDGVPKGAMMTPALVDFTVREYYRTESLAVRRVREVKLYKDSFDEWRMLSGASRAPDVRTYEPAAK